MILFVLIALLYILFAKSLLFDLLPKIISIDISTQYTILVGMIFFVLQFMIRALAGFEHNSGGRGGGGSSRGCDGNGG